jgi:hypothetical protein
MVDGDLQGKICAEVGRIHELRLCRKLELSRCMAYDEEVTFSDDICRQKLDAEPKAPLRFRGRNWDPTNGPIAELLWVLRRFQARR